MTKLEEFLSLMESFPSAFAQPNNGFMPKDIMEMAAEIRQKTNMPRADIQPQPPLGAMPPVEWRYEGNCNGCGAPIVRQIIE